MALRAWSRRSSKVPPGQAASSALEEVDVGPPDANGADLEQGPSGVAAGDGPAPGQEEYAYDEQYWYEDYADGQGDSSEITLEPAQWSFPPAPGPAGGWDAEGTAAWDPSTVWAVEDAGDLEDRRQPWYEEVAWEGETVVWEAERPVVSPGPLPQPEWSGAPASSPAPEGGYLPAHLRSPEGGVPGYTGRETAPVRFRSDDGRVGADRAKRSTGPWRQLVIIAALAVIAAAVILAVTSAEKNNLTGTATPPAAPSGSSTGAGPVSSSVLTRGGRNSETATLSKPGSTVGSPPATVRTSGPPATLSQRAEAKPVTPDVEQSLIRSWLAANPGGYGLGPADVVGTVPNQAYYAVQPATGTYWAVAAFEPSAALEAQSSTPTGRAELAEFHHSLYAFSWQAGPVWTLLGEFSTGNCPAIWVPRAVLTAWGLCGL